MYKVYSVEYSFENSHSIYLSEYMDICLKSYQRSIKLFIQQTAINTIAKETFQINHINKYTNKSG